jgi:hypothetical protein
MVSAGGRQARGFDLRILDLDQEATPQSIAKGRRYLQADKVLSLTVAEGLISAEVEGSQDRDYYVTLPFDDDSGEPQIKLARGSCTCPAYWEYDGACKHIVAVALAAQESSLLPADRLRAALAGQTGQMRRRKSDPAALDLLKQEALRIATSAGGSGGSLGASGSVILQPTFQPSDDFRVENWCLTFKIGTDKLYVVKDINELKTAIVASDSIQLGQKSSIWVGREAFTESSKAVVDFLLDRYDCKEEYYYYSARRRKKMVLTPADVDAFFDAMSGNAVRIEVEDDKRDGQKAHYNYYRQQTKVVEFDVVADTPSLKLMLEPQSGGAVLRSNVAYQLIEGQWRLYMICDQMLYSCGEKFSAACRKLLLALEEQGNILIFASSMRHLLSRTATPRRLNACGR